MYGALQPGTGGEFAVSGGPPEEGRGSTVLLRESRRAGADAAQSFRQVHVDFCREGDATGQGG